MGVVYKLNPQIKEFILKQKELNPTLSCRKFVPLVEKKFKLRLSKSHINSLIKSVGLSNPKGRTPNLRKTINLEGLGVLLLKIVDMLLGGIPALAEITQIAPSFLEAYLYLYLFTPERIKNLRWQRILNFTPQRFFPYLNDLNKVIINEPSLKQRLFNNFQDVLGIKLTFFDNQIFYLDAQLHCLWSTLDIPWDFSISYYKIKAYTNNLFSKNPLFVLFTSPGYENIPTRWFEFLLRLSYLYNRLTKISFLGIDLKEIETIYLDEPKNPFFIFGLWPWQYTKSRKIEILEELSPFYFKPLRKEFLIAEARVILTQPNVNKTVGLRGIVLKEESFSLIVLTNFPPQQTPKEKVVELYLNFWPNLKEGFEDFSKRIESFTYHIETHRVIPKENLFPSFNKPSFSLSSLLEDYLYFLDTYLRWHFFPLEYRQLDFSLMKERFYGLKGSLRKGRDAFYLILRPSSNYPFLKDLQIACRRINTMGVNFFENRRVWLLV